MKIPLEIIPETYVVSKKVYDSELKLKEAVEHLVSECKLGESTARAYINNFRCLKLGQKLTRTLNADSIEYFFANFLIDYGKSQLSNPLSALIQHIEYFEEKQKHKSIMRLMRAIHQKYSLVINSPTLISQLDHITENIKTIENYLTEGTDDERLETSKLIKRGTCFVAYKIGQELRFAPSRFLGYENNSLFKFPTTDIDGRETNKRINSILKSKPFPDKSIENKYIEYCLSLGINPQLKGGAYAVTRKYWTINFQYDFENNDNLFGEFPEGKIVERIHKARERNSHVVQIAKRNFKKQHGKLFCQVCRFDFEENFGEIGKDFIEGHHTIAVSDMPPEHKTKPSDIAMLCSNCHRMIHKKRPWLTMEQIANLLIM